MNKYENAEIKDIVHVGEPYFLLRAQDILAPHAIQNYAALLRAAAAGLEHGDTVFQGKDRDSVDRLRAQAEECDRVSAQMISWQSTHSVKLPD